LDYSAVAAEIDDEGEEELIFPAIILLQYLLGLRSIPYIFNFKYQSHYLC